jgi:hypothetical protein
MVQLVAAISFVAMLARRGYKARKGRINGFCADLALNNANSGPRASSVVSALLVPEIFGTFFSGHSGSGCEDGRHGGAEI